MDEERARSVVERAKAAVSEPCFISVTPRQLRMSQGEWLMLGSIWTADNTRAWQVWYHPGTDEGRLWPLIVTTDGVIPRTFEP